MDMGICSRSCATAESLGEAAEAQSWVSFRSSSLCRVALLGGGGMVRAAGNAPRRVPSSPLEAVLVAGSPTELLARGCLPSPPVSHLQLGTDWGWGLA